MAKLSKEEKARKKAEEMEGWPTYGAPGHEVKPDPKQIYATPDPFMKWVGTFWGERTLDACALLHNAKARNFIGPPGYVPESQGQGLPLWLAEDGLKSPWNVEGLGRPMVWCNPGFADVEPWLEKALEESIDRDAHVLLLTHVSTARWFRKFHKHATVWLPYPRIDFIAPNELETSDSNPRDSMLWEFCKHSGIGQVIVPEEWPKPKKVRKARKPQKAPEETKDQQA